MENQVSTEIKYNNQEVKLEEPQNFKSLFGLFRTVSAVPIGKPTKFSEQIVIYTNSTTYRLYWYDSSAGVWHYILATA
jgi:hypothetical protein